MASVAPVQLAPDALSLSLYQEYPDALFCSLVEEQGWTLQYNRMQCDSDLPFLKNIPPSFLPPRFMMDISGHFESSNKIRVSCEDDA